MDIRSYIETHRILARDGRGRPALILDINETHEDGALPAQTAVIRNPGGYDTVVIPDASAEDGFTVASTMLMEGGDYPEDADGNYLLSGYRTFAYGYAEWSALNPAA